MTTAHFVIPADVDDPTRPSGGNIYDRKVINLLEDSGWRVVEHPIAGEWPCPDATAHHCLAEALAGIPDDAVVVIDGLLASAAASVVVPAAGRLRLVALVHLPLGDQPPGHEVPRAREQEQSVLAAAVATIATSEWTRGQLLRGYAALDPRRVHVAEPGVQAATQAPGTQAGSQLLCVAAVTRHKGLDLLVESLSTLAELSWHCNCVGALDREPAFAADLLGKVASAGLADRVSFTGPLVGPGLDESYASADLLVLPSRGETYGMVVTEAFARGLPVVATAVGGVPETVGRASDGSRPGLLIPPDDPAALAAAIRRWLGDPSLREALRRSAAERRSTLLPWSETARRVAEVLATVAVGG